MNTRSLLCGAPTAAAGMTCHSASNPTLAKSASTSLNPIDKCPRTFSISAYRGRKLQMASNIFGHKCRGSVLPPRLPAVLNGWQGYPPQITSGRSTFVQSICFMSPKFGTSGQCFFNTLQANGSISDCQITFMPARSNPKSKPPMPLNNEPTVNVICVLDYPTKCV